MPNSNNSAPWDDKSYIQGINASLDNELLGKGKEGEYLSSLNLRPNNMDGDFGKLKTVFGEELLYGHADNSPEWTIGGKSYHYYALPSVNQNFYRTKWVCMAADYVIVDGDKTLVELWADTATTNKSDPFIRVGGNIVAASPDLPISVEYPIQMDTGDSQDGCEIFFTNNHDAPMYLDLYDVLKNAGITVGDVTGVLTDKYFAGFVLDEHSLQLKSIIHHPVFIAITKNIYYPNATVFVPPLPTAPGLNVGQYCYRVRYVNDSGDKTALSIPTPLIPVLYENGAGETTHPNIDKYGAAEGTKSSYGVILKVRVENRVGFEYLEITRASYANGEAVGSVPSEQIVGRIAIVQNEISVKTIVDFGGYEGDVTTEDSADSPRTIEAAKSVRYFSGRTHLFNVKYAENVVTDEILTNAETLPILKNIGMYGHADPYNHTYFKEFMGGEKYGLAIVFFDGTFSRTLALQIPDAQSYQFPDRRTKITSDALKYCYDGNPTGCDEDNNIDANIYERFSLDNAITKVAGDTLYTLDVGAAYKILTPIGQEGTFKDGIDQQINKAAEGETYNPKGFRKEYYSLGAALKGIDPDKIPAWATGFTIVRTVKAGRVLAQGLGFYSFTSGQKKDLSEVCFYSPELDSLNGLLSVDNIDINSVKADIVAPYGYFSECYNGYPNEETPLTPDTNWGDVALYAHVIKDSDDINVDGSDNGSSGNTLFGKWRNTTVESLFSAGKPDSLKINSIALSNSGMISTRADGSKSEYYILSLDSPIYSNEEVTDEHYADATVKEFHEPLYLINLVNESAIVPDTNVMNYYDTGTYIKLKSCIGQFNPSNLDYVLLDERWEDCMPPATNNTGKTDWFIYVGEERKAWICANGRADIATIQADINGSTGYSVVGGVNVYGIYTGVSSDIEILDTITYTEGKQYLVRFGYSDGDSGTYLPVSGEEIWVYFDSEMPVSVFGGDTYVGDSIFSPVDLLSGITGSPFGYALYCGLPYRDYTMSDYYSLMNASTGFGVATGGYTVRVEEIRQLVCMFVSESRIQQCFSYEIPTTAIYNDGNYPSFYKFFPRTNYVMRPYAGVGYVYIDPQYKLDYPNEDMMWLRGGFHYRPKNNSDFYRESNLIIYPSKPKVGYTDITHRRTRVHYSLQRLAGVQGAPSIRTFLAGNIYDISDANGEIKYGYNALSNRGDNIYCFTDHGICLLLIGKNILSQADGTELATMIGTQGQYIGGEIWISNTVGMPKEMWRSAAESDNMLCFTNLDSAFAFAGGELEDIGRNMYHNRLYGDILKNITISPDHLTGGFDTLHKEYWIQIDNDTMAYDFMTKHWNDFYSYNFCKYVSFDNRMFGVGNRATVLRNRAQTYEMTSAGTLIGNAPILNMVSNVCAPQKGYPEKAVAGIAAKEFIRIKIASNVKPYQVNFYDYYGQGIQATLSAAESEYYLKDYTNFEQYIPRRLASADPERKRMQGKKLIFEIIYFGSGFELTQTSVQFKELR
jgi:hypothetical protein